MVLRYQTSSRFLGIRPCRYCRVLEGSLDGGRLDSCHQALRFQVESARVLQSVGGDFYSSV
jgi:hypothetical protein